MAEVVAYNPFLPEVQADPYPSLHALRGADPVHRSPFLGMWMLTRHRDVAMLLRDPRFSAERHRWQSMLRPGDPL